MLHLHINKQNHRQLLNSGCVSTARSLFDQCLYIEHDAPRDFNLLVDI